MAMFDIYKRGQGIYVRFGTVGGLALILLVGLNWLWDLLDGLRPSNSGTAPAAATQGVAASATQIATHVATTATQAGTQIAAATSQAVAKVAATGFSWSDNWLFVQAGVVFLVGALGALGIFMLVNNPKFAEFLIMTESEMKKVTWPSRKAVLRSTQVIIFMTFLFAAILWGIDLGFVWFFKLIGIIPPGGTA